MTAPNLAGVTSIIGKTAGSGSLTTDATTTIVTCPVDKVLKINSIVAANYGGSDSASITLVFMIARAHTIFHMALLSLTTLR